MSSLFNHVFIPITILIIFSNELKIDSKNIILLSLFGILPDIDIFFFHRASFHNIFILIIPMLAFVFMNREIFGIVSFYLISHIILDVFNGGVFLLYPFYNNDFFIRAELDSGINTILSYGISDQIVNVAKLGESIISSENVAVMILLVIIIFITIIKNVKEGRQNRML